ncbi:MAG: hypothetical protein UX78_C0020G0022 [Candidatus Amesbacteria bacterium GW2011_GWA2_47_11]|uniref:Uncharacterized protein n=1 Tax=Candidatus Amesbacteria bacterium GW2011_GWA2_47_11 TaxID=1618357 RepID=A0A0G1REC6_9BACT|nr:MAG: hypothetical protein UX78_C0020G0022 [Candidatus Amesbacteria bacterium GW2011_GWA2_47_11]
MCIQQQFRHRIRVLNFTGNLQREEETLTVYYRGHLKPVLISQQSLLLDSVYPCKVHSLYNLTLIHSIIHTMKEILISKEFTNRLWVIFLLISGFLLPNPWRLILILLSGILSGVYYGCYNDIMWRPNPEEKLSKFPHYRAHQMWIHIFCGLVGSIALYYLITR